MAASTTAAALGATALAPPGGLVVAPRVLPRVLAIFFPAPPTPPVVCLMATAAASSWFQGEMIRN